MNKGYSPEHQNIEYKSNWRDEYLKWVSGFANAKGGILYFGIDDSGNVVGLSDYRKLLEDIPNKIIQQLGLVVDVNLHQAQDQYYIEVIVPVSSVPISYRGIYHYRSGSTKQELKGIALQQFLLKKMGRTWDDLGLTSCTIADLDLEAIHFFLKKAVQSKRILPESADESLTDLAEKLNFLNQEREVKNAFVLLFGKNPQQYFTQAYFKIGRFGKDDSELISQDTIVCPLIYMADRVMEVLRNKYLKSLLSGKS